MFSHPNLNRWALKICEEITCCKLFFFFKGKKTLKMFPRNFSLMKQISVFATTARFQRPNRCVQKEMRNVYWK